MGRFCSYNDNYWMCDFETITKDTQYFKENNSTRVWLAYAKKFNPHNKPFEQDEILTTTIEDFFDGFWKRNESATIFFHNLSFDGEFIKWYLVENGFKYYFKEDGRKVGKGFTIFEDENEIYYIQCWKMVKRNNKKKLVQLYIRCSLKLLKLSVEELAKSYKLEIQKGVVDYNVEPFDNINNVPFEYIDYIKKDVEIVIRPLIDFNEVFCMRQGNRMVYGLSKLTIGSVSISLIKSYLYEKKFNWKEELYIDYETASYLRNWYDGGLTSFTRKYQYCITEKINGKVYDVNSMYPSVMLNNKVPIGEPIIQSKPLNDPEYDICMVKVFIHKAKLKNKDYPWVLRRKGLISMTMEIPKNHKFLDYFENGEAYYFKDELEWICKFYDVEYDVVDYVYFRSAYLFKEIVEKYYAIREDYKKEGNPKEKQIKNFLNNIYGKFGQEADKSAIIYALDKLQKGDALNDYIVSTVRNQDSCIGDLNCYICERKEAPKSSINVAIAACITKNARIKLYEAIWNNVDNFLYCDTDSVFLKDEAQGLDIHPTKLGAWDLEMEFDGFELAGSKLYNIYLKDIRVKSACVGINKKWFKENIKKGDIVKVNKVLDVGAKRGSIKVKGGMVIIEKEIELKQRF